MSLAAITRTLTLCQGLEVHGEGQLFSQGRALPVISCQHVAHQQPKGHQQHPQGVGQDALRYKVAVGVTGRQRRMLKSQGVGGLCLPWVRPLLILILCTDSLGEAFSPKSEQEETACMLLALWRDTVGDKAQSLLMTAEVHSPIA